MSKEHWFKEAIIIGDHPHQGAKAVCIGSEKTGIGKEGLKFKRFDTNEEFFVFDESKIEWQTNSPKTIGIEIIEHKGRGYGKVQKIVQQEKQAYYDRCLKRIEIIRKAYKEKSPTYKAYNYTLKILKEELTK